MTDIDSRYRRFLLQGGGLIVLLSGIMLAGAVMLSRIAEMVTPMIVGIGFAVVVELADATVWRHVAGNSPDSLPTFFMAVSGIRMLLALAVMFVYYLVAGSQQMPVFFLVFMAYYFVVLIHHTVYFSKSRSAAAGQTK